MARTTASRRHCGVALVERSERRGARFPARWRRSGKTRCAKPALDDGAGHAPDGAGGLILGEHVPPLAADEAAAGQAVGAHAGENHREHAGAVNAQQPSERAHRPRDGNDSRADPGSDEASAARRSADGLTTSRCQLPRAMVDGAGLHGVAFRRLRGPRRATAAVEPLGKQAGEDLRHVLHDKDGKRKTAGKRGQQNIERSRAAGGDADGDNGRGGRRWVE